MSWVRVVFLLPILLLVSACLSPAFSKAAIYVSEQGNVAWCYNSGSRDEARKCAFNYCQDGKNTNCELELDCNAGWAAIAYGKTAGYGMLCNGSDKSMATFWALAGCIRAVKGKCYTTGAFREGGKQATEDENRATDNLLYAQLLLTKLGYYDGVIDGVSGPMTQAAISKFQQTKPELAVSGDADDATVRVLIDAVGGENQLVAIVMEATDGKIKSEWGLKTSTGPNPAPSAQVAAQNAPPANPPGEDPVAQIPRMQPETLDKWQTEISAIFESAFQKVGDFEFADAIECQAGPKNFPYTCTMKAVDKRRGQTAALELELFAYDYKLNLFSPKGSVIQDEIINARINDDGADGQQLKSTNSYSFIPKDGSAEQKYDSECNQTIGKHDSEAICAIPLDDRLVLQASVPPIDQSTPHYNYVEGQPPTPDIGRAKELLLRVFADVAALQITKQPTQ